MSIYGSSTAWTGMCNNNNQSPINLSQATAKPCDLLCELVFDDAYIPQANVIISNEGMILQSTSSLGSCKFNGEGYTCQTLLLTHPSHHTIENIQADAEVVAIFTNPTGKFLCVSSLVRVNPNQTDSSHFFNAFVPYGNPSVEYTPVNMGSNWGLFMMVPPTGAYYVYDGSLLIPPCQPTKWVVFNAMINIDGNDFAHLVKNVLPGSRPIQSLGDREVYFNSTEQLAGGPFPHDNKTYMRCKRIGSKGGGTVKPVTAAPLQAAAAENSGVIHGISQWSSEQIKVNGGMAILDVILLILSFVIGVLAGRYVSNSNNYGLYPISWGQMVGVKIREYATWLLSIFTWLYRVTLGFVFKKAPTTYKPELAGPD